jgi:hypothetical protein
MVNSHQPSKKDRTNIQVFHKQGLGAACSSEAEEGNTSYKRLIQSHEQTTKRWAAEREMSCIPGGVGYVLFGR